MHIAESAGPIDLAEVAHREEARQAVAMRETADEWREVAGGIACRGEPGSWVNNAANLGMNGRVDRAEIESLVEWYVSRGIEPRIELCPYAHPSLLAACASLGFVVSGKGGDAETDPGEATGSPGGFETVLFRELVLPADDEPVEPIKPPCVPPSEWQRQIRAIDPANSEEVRSYARVALSGFFPPEYTPSESDYGLVAKTVNHPRTRALGAWVRDENGQRILVAAAACEISDGIAALFGTTVLPAYRRRGLQQMLIAERLNLAIDAWRRHNNTKPPQERLTRGIATIGTRPRIATERNVRRMGFQVAYTKVILVKPGPGLKGFVS